MSEASAKSRIGRVLMAKLMLLFLITFLLSVLFLSVDTTPFSIYNKQMNFGIKAFLPEGWGFFTRDPQEEKLRVYHVMPDCQLKELQFAVASKENHYGFSRKVRKRNFELSKLVHHIPEDRWTTVSGKRENLKINCAEPALKLALSRKDFVLLEDQMLLFYRYQIIPWEWSKLTEIEKGRKVHISVTFE